MPLKGEISITVIYSKRLVGVALLAFCDGMDENTFDDGHGVKLSAPRSSTRQNVQIFNIVLSLLLFRLLKNGLHEHCDVL